MKKALKIIYIASMLIFAFLWILSKFTTDLQFNTIEIRNIFVIIYLISSLKYYQMEVNDKEVEIKRLKTKLKSIQEN